MMFAQNLFFDQEQSQEISRLEKDGQLNRRPIKALYKSILYPALLGLGCSFLYFIKFQYMAGLLVISLSLILSFLNSNKTLNKFIKPYSFGEKVIGIVDFAGYKYITFRTPKQAYTSYIYKDKKGITKKDFACWLSPIFLKELMPKKGDKIIIYIDEKSGKTAPYYKSTLEYYCLNQEKIVKDTVGTEI